MKKILAIDDNNDNLITVKAILKQYIPDSIIFTAQSGVEGIDVAIKEKPDTILLDIIMPNMDGYEVCEKLKSNSATSRIPIIMFTAIKTDAESRIKGLNIGADAFASKPIDPLELTAQVNVMLRIKNAEDKLRNEKNMVEGLVDNKTKELININRMLEEKINTLERFSKVVVNRELKMIELKKENNDLLIKMGEKPKYKVNL